MFSHLCALFVLALVSSGQAQTSSFYVQPTVPTGTPIPGNYTGALRPQIHFSPPQWFMVSENSITSQFTRVFRFVPPEGRVLLFDNSERSARRFKKAESDGVHGQMLNHSVRRMIRMAYLLTPKGSITSTINVCRRYFHLSAQL